MNAPEPAVLDYNTEGTSEALYAPDFYRFSDHDPIVVGIDYADFTDPVTNQAGTDSPVELRRLNDSAYAFEGMRSRGRYFVTNVAGQLLQRGRVDAIGNRIELGELPRGTYFVVLRERDRGQATFKLIR